NLLEPFTVGFSQLKRKATPSFGFSHILHNRTGQRQFFIISATGKIAGHIDQFDSLSYRAKTDRS
ncbi:MAG TPA: hypothetical protein PLM81_11020, partial [Ginsengibacter sp.]|nr:hypothetical protein [Ginsengibacter sp.]